MKECSRKEWVGVILGGSFLDSVSKVQLLRYPNQIQLGVVIGVCFKVIVRVVPKETVAGLKDGYRFIGGLKVLQV